MPKGALARRTAEEMVKQVLKRRARGARQIRDSGVFTQPGAVDEIIKRQIKGGPIHPLADIGDVSPELKAQVHDLIHGTGARYTPEQTQKALAELNISPQRMSLLSDIADQKWLNDPGIERGYIFGSSATGKLNPTDLDIYLRAAPDSKGAKALRKAERQIPARHDVVSVEGMPISDADQALRIAQRGVKKHGKDHTWKRIIGVGGATAAGGSLLTPDEAEAISVKSILKAARQAGQHKFIKAFKEGKIPKEHIKHIGETHTMRDLGFEAGGGMWAKDLDTLDTIFEPYGEGAVDAIKKKAVNKGGLISLAPSLEKQDLLAHELGHSVYDNLPRSVQRQFLERAQKQPKVKEELDQLYQGRRIDYGHELFALSYADQTVGSGSQAKRLLGSRLQDTLQDILKNPRMHQSTEHSLLGQAGHPAGVFTKATKKAVGGVLSSSTNRLKGHTLEGRVIKEVRQGRGDWRAIIFEDGSMQTTNKKYINDLCRSKGTKEYMDKYARKDQPGKMSQAINSLRYHEARAWSGMTRDTARKLHRDHLTRAKQFGQDVPPNTVFVFYNGKFFQMPKMYAEALEDTGVLEILKDRRSMEATKPFTRKDRIKKVPQR